MTINQLKEITSLGHIVVTNNDGIKECPIAVYSQLVGTENIYFGCGKTVEEALEMLRNNPYSIDDNHHWSDETIINVIGVKPKILPVGTKVKILEVARECEGYKGWDENKQKMIGEISDIREYFDDNCGVYYEIYTKDKTSYFTFPHYCVSPAYEQDEEVEKAVELLKSKGYKVEKDD